MRKNMGRTDVWIRTLTAIVIVVLYFFEIISGATAIVLLAIAGIFLLTSAMGYCPLYGLFGVSTRRKES